MCFLTSPRQTSSHGAQDGAAHFVLPPAASVRRRRLVVLQARPLRFALAHCDPAHVALAPCPARQMAGEQAPRLLVVGPRQQRRELAEASVGLRCRQPRHRREVHARDCPRQSGRRHKVPALDARDVRRLRDGSEKVPRGLMEVVPLARVRRARRIASSTSSAGAASAGTGGATRGMREPASWGTRGCR